MGQPSAWRKDPLEKAVASLAKYLEFAFPKAHSIYLHLPAMSWYYLDISWYWLDTSQCTGRVWSINLSELSELSWCLQRCLQMFTVACVTKAVRMHTSCRAICGARGPPWPNPLWSHLVAGFGGCPIGKCQLSPGQSGQTLPIPTMYICSVHPCTTVYCAGYRAGCHADLWCSASSQFVALAQHDIVLHCAWCEHNLGQKEKDEKHDLCTKQFAPVIQLEAAGAFAFYQICQ